MARNRRFGMNVRGGGYMPHFTDTGGTTSANKAREETNTFIANERRRWDKRLRKALKSPCAIRPMVIEDAAYVLDSWANSYRRSIVTGPIEREVFNIEQRARINRLVQRSTARVFVACDAEDKNKIRGWICFETPRGEHVIPVIHYVCIQPAHQQQGIGTALVELARQTASDPQAHMWTTHETQPMRHIREKWNLLYNPYLLEVSTQSRAAVAPEVTEQRATS